MQTLIKIEHLTKQFPNQATPALKEIHTEIQKGQIVGVVGPDGSGKTTFMRTLAALLLPTKGSVTIGGFNTIKDAESIHELTGYMPQKFGLYEELTVMQNLTLYADLCGLVGEDRKTTFEKLLHFTNLAPFTNRLARNLSGGMKQKLGLACALLKKPTLLLLDEPSVGVDPVSRRELWKIIHSLSEEGVSVLWSTSYLDEAEKCQTVLVLNNGELLYQGAPKPHFQEFFIDLLGGVNIPPSRLAAMMPQVKKPSGSVITANSLTKRFGSFTSVDNVSFSVKRGEIFGLLGPNGAGKSTIFKMLCGLLRPTSGNALVSGLDLQKAPGEARSLLGYMAQKFSLYGNLSVKQNLEFFSGIYNLKGAARKNAIDEMIDIFDLDPYLNSSPDLLPLGFKQRLALACANMHHPEVLFLDEPTSGVDPITRREFWGHIKGLVKKNVTILVTTHFLDEAEYCDTLALIYQGHIIHKSTPKELKEVTQSSTLEEAFIQKIEEYDESHKSSFH